MTKRAGGKHVRNKPKGSSVHRSLVCFGNLRYPVRFKWRPSVQKPVSQQVEVEKLSNFAHGLAGVVNKITFPRGCEQKTETETILTVYPIIYRVLYIPGGCYLTCFEQTKCIFGRSNYMPSMGRLNIYLHK